MGSTSRYSPLNCRTLHLHLRPTLRSDAFTPHGRVDTQDSVRPAQRLWHLRVSNIDHATYRTLCLSHDSGWVLRNTLKIVLNLPILDSPDQLSVPKTHHQTISNYSPFSPSWLACQRATVRLPGTLFTCLRGNDELLALVFDTFPKPFPPGQSTQHYPRGSSQPERCCISKMHEQNCYHFEGAVWRGKLQYTKKHGETFWLQHCFQHLRERSKQNGASLFFWLTFRSPFYFALATCFKKVELRLNDTATDGHTDRFKMLFLSNLISFFTRSGWLISSFLNSSNPCVVLRLPACHPRNILMWPLAGIVWYTNKETQSLPVDGYGCADFFRNMCIGPTRSTTARSQQMVKATLKAFLLICFPLVCTSEWAGKQTARRICHVQALLASEQHHRQISTPEPEPSQCGTAGAARYARRKHTASGCYEICRTCTILWAADSSRIRPHGDWVYFYKPPPDLASSINCYHFPFPTSSPNQSPPVLSHVFLNILYNSSPVVVYCCFYGCLYRSIHDLWPNKPGKI